LATSNRPASIPDCTARTGKVPIWAAKMSKVAGADGVTGLSRPRAGISMSSPKGASTWSRSSSPRSMRTLFGGRFEIRMRETSSSPLGRGGPGLVLCALVAGCVVVVRVPCGEGRNAAASVEITSSTSMTTTNRRAATPVA
jgi:hypothetical protein